MYIYISVYISSHIHIYMYKFEHVQSDSTCVCTYIARIHTSVHTCKNTFTMPKPVIVLASLCYTCSCYLLCCVLLPAGSLVAFCATLAPNCQF